MIMDFVKRLFVKNKPQEEKIVEKKRHSAIFTTHAFDHQRGDETILENAYGRVFQKEPMVFKAAIAQDGKQLKTALDGVVSVKSQFTTTTVPSNLIDWYASQSFIGYPVCAMISQQWLVMRACKLPAEDAVRNGYEVTINNGVEVNTKIIDKIRDLDIQYRINENMIEFLHMGRIFGIRIAMFVVDVPNRVEFYEKPFNIDGVPPHSYRGISQVDPYWITPILDSEAAGNPASMHFYEPTWWYISGLKVHRSHLIIFRTEELPDILKPTYIYGGVSIPQKIYERVYCAERTANEAPLLALTKRADVLKVDAAQALANQAAFREKIEMWRANLNNFGVKIIDFESEDMMQFDISLADFDSVIMTQYQLVSAIAGVPSVKLLGTSPKGFNATGEYEESSYHETLETFQKNDLNRLLNRHHMLLIKSEIEPDFGTTFETIAKWNALDAMTEKELQEVNKLKADTGSVLVQSGAIDGQDERDRIINDPISGYNGLSPAAPEPEEEPDDESSSNQD